MAQKSREQKRKYASVCVCLSVCVWVNDGHKIELKTDTPRMRDCESGVIMGFIISLCA